MRRKGLSLTNSMNKTDERPVTRYEDRPYKERMAIAFMAAKRVRANKEAREKGLPEPYPPKNKQDANTPSERPNSKTE